MTLTHPNGPTTQTRDLSILPIFELEGGDRIPRHEIPPATCRRTWPTRSSTTS
jgi:hypothetical protein